MTLVILKEHQRSIPLTAISTMTPGPARVPLTSCSTNRTLWSLVRKENILLITSKADLITRRSNALTEIGSHCF